MIRAVSAVPAVPGPLQQDSENSWVQHSFSSFLFVYCLFLVVFDGLIAWHSLCDTSFFMWTKRNEN